MKSKEIKEFIKNRFSDNGPGPNDHPTRLTFAGVTIRIVYWSFSGRYQYYINEKTNSKLYQPTNYLMDKVISEVISEVKGGVKCIK